MPHYFQDVATGLDDLIAILAGHLTTEGWTERVLNSSTGQPPVGSYRQERMFRMNGTVAHPTRGFVSIGRVRDSNANSDRVQLSGFCGMKNFDTPIDVSNVSKSSGTTSVTTIVNTVQPHGLVIGDIVVLNGTDNDYLNNGSGINSVETADHTIVASATASQLVYYSNYHSGGTGAIIGNGGYLMGGMYSSSTRSTYVNGGVSLVLSDGSCTVFGYVDEFRCCGIVLQGAAHNPFYIGMTGREHIPPDYQDTAFLQSGVSAGSGVTISLDRACANIRAGQKIWFIHPTSHISERVTVLTKPTASTFTCTIANSYPSGTLVGEDPVPLLICGSSGVSGSSTLAAKAARFPFHLNATRTSPVAQTMTPGIDSSLESSLDPDCAGYHHGRDIILERTTAGTEGVRGPMTGLAAFSIGLQNDQDLMRVGGDAGDDDYKVFVSQAVESGWSIGIGPGAF